MKALAVDSSITRLTVAAMNNDKTVTAVYNIGMKQSEILLPSIEYVLTKAGLTSAELECTVIAQGPGSFTGLRLGFAACKALEQAHNIPVYGIPTLEAYAFPYRNLPFTVLSVIDAKQDRFYAAVYKNGKEVLASGDYEMEKITASLPGGGQIFVCGPDASLVKDILDKTGNYTLYAAQDDGIPALSLFALAQQKIDTKQESLRDFDGPLYLRPSEAEVKTNA